MANTYSKIYLQTVFAVKHRQALLHKTFREDLFKYMAGIIKSEGQFPIKINGVEDHVHLAFAIHPKIAVSDLMRKVKANSSKWINQQGFLPQQFEWQRGFGAFSYGQSQMPVLIRYIENQEAHHKKQTFKEEYLGFLNAFQVKYDEEFLFDWIFEK